MSVHILLLKVCTQCWAFRNHRFIPFVVLQYTSVVFPIPLPSFWPWELASIWVHSWKIIKDGQRALGRLSSDLLLILWQWLRKPGTSSTSEWPHHWHFFFYKWWPEMNMRSSLHSFHAQELLFTFCFIVLLCMCFNWKTFCSFCHSLTQG